MSIRVLSCEMIALNQMTYPLSSKTLRFFDFMSVT